MRRPGSLSLLGRFHAALTDPARSGRAAFSALAVYVVLWTVYGTVAKSSQGLHPDMTEVIAWSRDLALGYLKHPPLSAAAAAAWFAIFPVAEWSYYLLAMLMPGIALGIAWRLSADYLDAQKRLAALALLTLIPFFNFHALKYNVNTVLIPLWAATAYFFLRSYCTRGALDAALAGLAAAGAMYGKYWSVFLLAGLVLAALIDTRRGAYFRSAAPWITVIVGALALAPHAVWLVQHDFAPFSYAMGIHGDKPFAAVASGVLGYLLGSLGYVALPLVIVLAMARPSLRTLADMAWPADNERRLVAVAFWGPFLLPALGALATGTEITSLWSMPAWTLFGVLLLSPPAIEIGERAPRRLLVAAMAVPPVMLLASPLIAIVVQRSGPPPAGAQGSLLAAEVERAWHVATPEPLRYVGGDSEIAYAVIAYAAEEPKALPGLPPPDAAELARSGMALVCFAEETNCRRQAAARAAGIAGARTTESTIVRNFLRQSGKPQGYTIVVVPPRR